MFILATTELHKVPATISPGASGSPSNAITPADVARRLAFVAEQEGIDLKGGRRGDSEPPCGRRPAGRAEPSGPVCRRRRTIDSGAVLEVLGLAGNLQTAQLIGADSGQGRPRRLCCFEPGCTAMEKMWARC